MFEVANHNPEPDEFPVKMMYLPSGYLQLRNQKGSKNATALYWSNEAVTTKTVSDILKCGYAADFDEITFYFNTKYKYLFVDCNVVRESVEIEKNI
jgi:hypothetical protein